MISKLHQSKEYKKEVADISTFTNCYVPNVCNNIYNMFGYEVLDMILSDICLTAQFYNDADKCLKQIRACFRMANMRYPLDLSVYEDTKTGRVLIIQYFVEKVSNFTYEKSKETAIKEDLEVTPLSGGINERKN